MKGIPLHGSRARYRKPWACRCLNCTQRDPIKAGGDLRWPFRTLERFIGLERLSMWITDEQIETWRTDGLSDREADEMAVRLAFLPCDIWGGYISAGLDYQESYG